MKDRVIGFLPPVFLPIDRKVVETIGVYHVISGGWTCLVEPRRRGRDGSSSYNGV